MKGGRKFAVVLLNAVLLGIGMSAGVLAAINNVDLPWLTTTLPILASVMPAYIGANAVQKSAQIKAAAKPVEPTNKEKDL